MGLRNLFDRNVAYWPLADTLTCGCHVRSWGVRADAGEEGRDVRVSI